MLQHQAGLEIATKGRGLYEITREVAAVVKAAKIKIGLATIFCRHTSCSIIVNENADPDVRHDLEAFMKRLVPDGDPHFVHILEGPDDMAAHIKTALTASSLSIPIADGRLALGTWQGIYLFEHRVAPHRRQAIVHVFGE
ncbi:MAG: secondary thiamine-phosphate synthase enzyme YjbQ [Aestuariivirga sp.]